MKTNLITDKKIAIVGGGPGGLTLARLLQLNGGEVKVYERDLNKDARVQGATLDLHEESGLKALDKAGLMDAFKANYRPDADKIRILDKHANIIVDEHAHNNQKAAEFGDEHFRPEIDRGPLRKILLESLQDNTVVWDSQFSTMEPTGQGWTLEFKNGTTAYADIVIAADGANSKIRPLITNILPFYSGVTVVEGTVYNAEAVVPNIAKLLKNGKLFVFGDSKSLIVSSKEDDALTFYTGCKTEEQWAHLSGVDFTNAASVLSWFKSEFEGWDTIWDGLFTNAALPFIPRPQYCMPLDQSWEPLTNLTMLGDAAHLMPPYAGEGVNMAMLDALELSDCLTGNAYPDVATAIAAFEKQMCKRTSQVAKDTLYNTEVLHSPEALQFMTNVIS